MIEQRSQTCLDWCLKVHRTILMDMK